MLNYAVLEGKPILTKTVDGVKVNYKDLLSESIRDKNSTLYDFRVIYVTADYIARPDLISLAAYGDDGLADIICKINGISNPFELNEGMTLVIPPYIYARNFVTAGKVSSVITNKDDVISAREQTNRKQKNERRSPAEQTIGDNTFIIDRTNKIVYY